MAVAPSTRVNVRLEYRPAGCDPSDLQPNGYTKVASLSLRYRTLGITRRATCRSVTRHRPRRFW